MCKWLGVEAATRSYGYDRAGRLTTVVDQSTGECVTRQYTFDKQGNRTGLTTVQPGADGSCGAGASTSRSWTYDLSSRVRTTTGGAAYGYDVLGRVTVLPGVDAPHPGKGDVTLGYFESDAARSITQDGVATEYTLDSLGRRLTETTTAAGTVTGTVTRYYTDGSDNPSWVVETLTGQPSVTSRYTPSLGGGLGATVTGGAVSLDVTDPHGDVVTTIPVSSLTGDAVAVSGWAVFDEYGTPLTTPDTTAVDTGVARYGWLGSHERATTDTGLILMGARLYNPTTGRFLSPDPVPGGNENAYNYPNDPVNKIDVDGRFAWALAGLAFGPVGWIVTGVLLLAVVGYAVYDANRHKANFNWSNKKASGKKAKPNTARRPTASVRAGADKAATDSKGAIRCAYCGKKVKPTAGHPNSKEYDHVVPHSRGGGREADNISVSCRTCNRSKAAKTLDEWRRK